MSRLKLFPLIALISVIPTLAVWLPFYLNTPKVWGIPIPEGGMQTVASNYDGPLYIAVAKSMYQKDIIQSSFSFTLPYEYYAAHFPLYPVLIRALAQVTGYVWGMLGVVLLTSIGAHIFFFLFAREYTKSDNEALWLTFIFGFLPARWLIVRSVGSPEPLFLMSIIASLYFFKKEKYLWAGVAGALAQLTKSPGILLFASYAVFLALDYGKKIILAKNFKSGLAKINVKSLFLLLIPLSLLGLFSYYQSVFGDFFAYFNSGDNIHLFFPPFQIFNYSQPWVNTHWLEDVIFVYMIGALAFVNLIYERNWRLVSFFAFFFISLLFVSHRDVLRYSLPLLPLVIISFREYLSKPQFKIVMLFLIIPVYLMSLVFIGNNTMSISNWGQLL